MAELVPETPKDGLPRRYFSVSAATPEELVAAIPVAEGTFALFLACDATRLSDESIHALSLSLIEKGIAYLVSWGPDCSRLHDRFDLAEVVVEIDSGVVPAVMTSWHEDQSLEEALYFFVFLSIPHEEHEESCHTAIAASIGNPAWAASLRAYLADIEALKTAVELQLARQAQGLDPPEGI